MARLDAIGLPTASSCIQRRPQIRQKSFRSRSFASCRGSHEDADPPLPSPAILVGAAAALLHGHGAVAQRVEQLEAGRQTATRIDRLEVLLDEVMLNELRYVASARPTPTCCNRPVTCCGRSPPTASARTVGRAGHVLGRRSRRHRPSLRLEERASARTPRRARSDGSGSLVHRDHTDTSDAAGAVACTPACGIGGRCRWQIEKREAGLMALAGVALLPFTLVRSSRGSTASPSVTGVPRSW